MASLRDIRRRIASVQNTRKITKAMEMVAAAKLRRNQPRIEALRPYAGDMIEMMIDLATYSRRDARSSRCCRSAPRCAPVAVVAMTGDRGLAGAFNANVVRKALEIERGLREAGRRDARARRRPQGHRHADASAAAASSAAGRASATGPSTATPRRSRATLIELYVSGAVDRVRLVYNHFTSPIEQTLMDDVILPVPREAVTGEARRPGR